MAQIGQFACGATDVMGCGGGAIGALVNAQNILFNVGDDLTQHAAAVTDLVLRFKGGIDCRVGVFCALPVGSVRAAATASVSASCALIFCIKITAGSARIAPQGGTKLCVINPGGDESVPYTSPSFAANWTCETITYASDQCDIKTDGGDPCRMIGGTCIKY